MRSMRRLLLLAVLLALAGSSVALAGRGDPQERFTPADQARAKSMLLRQADLGAGFSTTPVTEGGDFYCKALDESDLTLTAESVRRFARSSVGVLSLAQVYESLRDANTSWRRGTSRAGETCFGDALRRQLDERRRPRRHIPAPRLSSSCATVRGVPPGRIRAGGSRLRRHHHPPAVSCARGALHGLRAPTCLEARAGPSRAHRRRPDGQVDARRVARHDRACLHGTSHKEPVEGSRGRW